MAERLTVDELIEEFVWTLNRHGGRITLAAPILGCSPNSLEKRMREARRAGLVHYVDDRKILR